ncbi:MAG: shikimate dehydrogenase family protein [Jiangellaceae bacterium]
MPSYPPPPPCARPTLYFVGVRTAGSSIMRVFPRWAEQLDLDAVIRGYDVAFDAPREAYRAIVRHLRDDPGARGALVTSHKIALLQAAGDLVDALDPYARTCGEVSCLAAREGRLLGFAKDPLTSAAAWRAFVPAEHFVGEAEVLCFGGGGAAVAISVAAADLPDPADRPRRMTFVEVDEGRLEHLRAVHEALDTDIAFARVLNDDVSRNDDMVGALPPGSMVINATGMGKDLPGSPVSDAAAFPRRGLAWELNYRGELDFLEQARRQRSERGLRVEDGWVYFLHGWSAVIAEVFGVDIDEARFRALDRAAADLRPEREA